MKILIDACIAPPVAAALRGRGHDVASVADWRHDAGDALVLEKALAEGRVVLTLDKDFGTLAIAQMLPHSGILRLVDLRIADQAQRAHEALERFGEQLLTGAIVTVEPTRIRIRPADKP